MTHCWFPSFSQGILAPVQNDNWMKERHNEGNVKRHPERTWRICYRSEENRYEDKSHQLWAVSCKLNILLRFESLQRASILNRTTCASELLLTDNSMIPVWDGKAPSWTNVKNLFLWWGKSVRCHQCNRFFTPCHYSVFVFLTRHSYPRSEWQLDERAS